MTLVLAIIVALLIAGLAFTIHEFKSHVVENPHDPHQTYHGEVVDYRIHH